MLLPFVSMLGGRGSEDDGGVVSEYSLPFEDEVDGMTVVVSGMCF